MDVQRALAAVAEPTRFRIVELLATGPCTVGEVADGIGALQPQTTKHLQALEAAGVVRVHKLGRRRVARLDRDSLTALAGYFDRLTETVSAGGDEAVLDDYERAIEREAARPEGRGGVRILRFERALPGAAATVWAAWTDPAFAVRWWAPRHFAVDEFTIAPTPGAAVRVALREGDGARYLSTGRVEAAEPPHRLVFSLAPVDRAGEPLFAARHTVTFAGGDPTTLLLTIEVSDVRAEAAPAVAGLEPGWSQLLDALEAILA